MLLACGQVKIDEIKFDNIMHDDRFCNIISPSYNKVKNEINFLLRLKKSNVLLGLYNFQIDVESTKDSVVLYIYGLL